MILEKKLSYKTKNIVIGTGSAPTTSLPGIKIDEKIVVSSTGALYLLKSSKKLNCNRRWLYWFRTFERLEKIRFKRNSN